MGSRGFEVFLNKESSSNIRRCYRIFKIFGLYPLNSDFSINALLFLYSAAVNATIISSNMWVATLNAGKLYVVDKSVLNTICLTQVVSSVVCFVYTIKSRKYLPSIYGKLIEFDRIVGEPVDEFSMGVMLFISYDLFMLVILLALSWKAAPQVFPFILNIIIWVTWTLINYYMKSLFLCIRPLAIRMERLIAMTKTKMDYAKLSALSDSYYILIDCTKILNEFIGLPALIYFLAFFFRVIVVGFMLYKSWCWDPNECVLVMFLLPAVVITYFILSMERMMKDISHLVDQV